MPLLKRKTVPLLPLPKELQNEDDLPEDKEVFLLKATGEIFLDFKSYSERMSFYLQKIFVCEYSGKSGLDYFEALDSEWNETKKTQEKFPDQLKPRVLRACQFQVEGRLERLADMAFDRFQDRFFLGEKVIVSNVDGSPSGTVLQYYGLIIRVDPPGNIAAQVPPLPEGQVTDAELRKHIIALDVVAHSYGTKIEIDKAVADAKDNSADYIYTVRLMEDATFKGSEVRLTHTSLTRDRQTWSKNLLKRYLKECMYRDPAVGSPWMVKQRLSTMYDIPTDMPEIMKQKSEVARNELLTKRKGTKGRKPGEDSDAEPPVPKAKRVKAEASPAIILNGTNGTPVKGEDAKAGPAPRAKAIKYPIDDLELDPTTIFDGRVRRSKHQELPPLPKKPLPSLDLPVSPESFTRFIQCWNILNIFGQALLISPFTLDDFTNAIWHPHLNPRCILLGEIHSVLTNNIAAEGFRIAGTTQATIENIPVLAATVYEYDDGMDVAEREKWVTKAFEYSRGWDRKARPKAADGRKGWESHLCGILTQRGGIETVPSLPRIFKHLFSTPVDDADDTEPLDPADPDNHEGGDLEKPLKPKAQKRNEWSAKDKQFSYVDPEENYLSLNIEDKLDILQFLCEMNLMSKNVKAYIDDCELRLTEERKEKAEINKEKKELLIEKATLLNPNGPATAAAAAATAAKTPLSLTKANGELDSAAATPNLTPVPDMDESMSLSVLPSDRDESVLPDEPYSRQPSSSPLPELDKEDLEDDDLNEDDEKPKVDTIEEKENGDDRDEEGDDSKADEEDEEQDDEEKDQMEVDHDNEADNEIGSEVDELQSSEDESAKKPVEPVRPARRQQAPKVTKRKKAVKPVDRKAEIEEELEMNAKKDDLHDRDWRRFREVARIRPLGLDRFYQRYWWFDGIGPQSLIAPNGRIIYGTGRLFVQGPTETDFLKAIDDNNGTEESLNERRRKEEGHDKLLGIDEWAFYDEEEQIEQLLAWLNVKGVREHALKASLTKWKHYIVEGAKSRRSDLIHGFEQAAGPSASRRTRGGRGRPSFEEPAQHYLAYENSLAQK